MLRSLVGSEMCIRDSIYLAPEKSLAVGSFFPDYFGPLGKTLIINDQHPACLLYTSDAADDLLCVDLGGRRIIKKKTHHHLQLVTHSPVICVSIHH